MKKPLRTTIEDLSHAGTVLSDEQLQLVSGGMPKGSYSPASCTYNNDTDYYRD